MVGTLWIPRSLRSTGDANHLWTSRYSAIVFGGILRDIHEKNKTDLEEDEESDRLRVQLPDLRPIRMGSVGHYLIFIRDVLLTILVLGRTLEYCCWPQWGETGGLKA
jgi:hypothetical protein